MVVWCAADDGVVVSTVRLSLTLRDETGDTCVCRKPDPATLEHVYVSSRPWALEVPSDLCGLVTELPLGLKERLLTASGNVK